MWRKLCHCGDFLESWTESYESRSRVTYLITVGLIAHFTDTWIRRNLAIIITTIIKYNPSLINPVRPSGYLIYHQV
jgi:hypothetical protein